MEYGVRSSNNNNKWSSLSSTLLEGEKEMEGYNDGGGGYRDLVCMVWSQRVHVTRHSGGVNVRQRVGLG